MAQSILIVGANWLGDSVMSMPAIQVLKRTIPDATVTLLVRKPLIPLWRLHRGVDSVFGYERGLQDTVAAVGRIRAGGFTRAFILPNSFRSALIPFLGGVPVRRGASGHWRIAMLTEAVQAALPPERRHQSWEYAAILGVSGDAGPLPAPEIAIDANDVRRAAETVGGDPNALSVALLPGAARGPSKQWPPEHFIEVGRRLVRETGCRILVFGAAPEGALCKQVAASIGPAAVSLAGRVCLADLPAALRLCRIAISNDSGGMHLAAAVGVRVVGIFGLTDPDRTGPLGAGHRIVAADGVQRSRDIRRDSAEARGCLRSIAPEHVYRAVRDILAEAADETVTPH